MIRFGVVCLLQMLSQQIFSVVVAVGCPQNGVNVVTRWLLRAKRSNAPLVVEFNQDDRAVNSIVEYAVVAGVSDPREKGPVEVSANFFHFDGRVVVTQ